MPIDRDETLKKAEKLLRQERLDAAAAEYLRVIEDHPRDWATRNTLGDLYVRAGRPDKAAAQYAGIAEHFMTEGFYPKAAAIYKKLLKLTPDDERAQLNLAEIAQKQGLLADAKARLKTVAARRRSRGDHAGAAEILVLLGALDPADFQARQTGAQTLADMGRSDEAAQRFRDMYEDLVERERLPDALAALQQAVDLNPGDREGRVVLGKAALEAGDFEGARRYLDREIAGDDPALLMAVLRTDLKTGRLDTARELLRPLLAGGEDQRDQLVDIAWSLVGSDPDAAFVIVDAAVDAAAAHGDFSDAAALLQEFVTRVPRQIPALLKLVEVCVDGGLEATMYEAQAELTDAYLATGQPMEARVIAEDLVAREPWERAHIDRFRRALVMLKVHDPDTLIADRLSGQEPFLTTDVFADPAPPQPPAEIAPQAAAAAAIDPSLETAPAETPVAAPAVSDPSASEPIDLSQRAPAPPIELASRPTELPALSRAEIELSEQIRVANPLGEPASPLSVGGTSSNDPFAEMFGASGPGAVVMPDDAGDRAAGQLALARTYIEMSMPDEALAPLAVVAKTTRFRFEAASTLGRLYGQRGELANAIEWFERAAEAPAPAADERYSVLYELGTLVEQAGDSSRALAVFLELQAEAGHYRDVAEKVERLARVETGG